MTNLFNQIIADNKVREDWNISVKNCFKNKGEATKQGNHKVLKLLEHMMKQKIRTCLLLSFNPCQENVDAFYLGKRCMLMISINAKIGGLVYCMENLHGK